MKALDLTGQRFGKLLVTAKIGRKHSGTSIYWLCQCDCGNANEVRASHLREGLIVSCGCHRNEVAAVRRIKHGQASINKGRSREYRSWQSMLERCANPRVNNWHRYAGRGIEVCAAWQSSFENFYADMGPCPIKCSLDRINNELGYSPENCRWATASQQARNRRNSTAVDWLGKKMTLAELAESTGVPYGALHRRIRSLGWPVDRAVNTPTRRERSVYSQNSSQAD